MSFALREGDVFAGRYEVVGIIATGGMGAVYEVIHLETERRRALKVMLPHLADSAEFRERFRLEARIAARIESEFIVEVFDAGIDAASGAPFLVMELLRGEELGKRLKRVGRFGPDETITYLHQAALALDRTHRAGIVHRDLKPGNLFLTEREDGPPRVKVLDFGVAKLLADTVANATASVGTPLYMAPEQFRGGALSAAADVHALGLIAYTFLVGRAYWADDLREQGHVLAFAMTAVKGPQEPACARAARAGVRLPPAFDAWFAQIADPDPGRRFRSASAAVRALAEALGLSPPPSTQPSSPGSDRQGASPRAASGPPVVEPASGPPAVGPASADADPRAGSDRSAAVTIGGASLTRSGATRRVSPLAAFVVALAVGLVVVAVIAVVRYRGAAPAADVVAEGAAPPAAPAAAPAPSATGAPAPPPPAIAPAGTAAPLPPPTATAAAKAQPARPPAGSTAAAKPLPGKPAQRPPIYSPD